jgi:ATP-binding cassette, subfamily B, bacterial
MNQLEEFRPLVPHIARHRRALGLSGLLLVLESGAALVLPWLAGRLTQQLITKNSAVGFGLTAVLWGMLAIVTLQAVLKFANQYLLNRTAEMLISDLRVCAYDHLQSLPLSFYDARRLGAIVSLLTQDVLTLGYFVSYTLLGILPLLLTVAGAVVLMFRLDAQLAVWTAVLVPLFYLLTKVMGRKLRPVAVQAQQEYATLAAMAEENLRCIAVIKAYTRERIESDRFRAQSDKLLQLSASQRHVLSGIGPGMEWLGALAIVLVLWLATQKLSSGALQGGDLVTLLLYGLVLTRPVGALANVYGQVQQARGAAQRLLQALQEPSESLAPGRRLMPAAPREICFRAVTFAYPGREPALRSLDLTIQQGEIVAITGPNGSGKTTLLQLLLRFYEPSDGAITIDGIDIRDLSIEQLRSSIGVVHQDTLLFAATLWENIAYGRPGASRSEIEAAARAAQVESFCKTLPKQYETMIGDGGVGLSGGQRRRVALARALLKTPPILLLDEPTATIDPAGELEFLTQCNEALRNKTVLLITHQAACLALASRVVVMNDGRVESER